MIHSNLYFVCPFFFFFFFFFFFKYNFHAELSRVTADVGACLLALAQPQILLATWEEKLLLHDFFFFFLTFRPTMCSHLNINS